MGLTMHHVHQAYTILPQTQLSTLVPGEGEGGNPSHGGRLARQLLPQGAPVLKFIPWRPGAVERPRMTTGGLAPSALQAPSFIHEPTHSQALALGYSASLAQEDYSRQAQRVASTLRSSCGGVIHREFPDFPTDIGNEVACRAGSSTEVEDIDSRLKRKMY